MLAVQYSSTLARTRRRLSYDPCLRRCITNARAQLNSTAYKLMLQFCMVSLQQQPQLALPLDTVAFPTSAQHICSPLVPQNHPNHSPFETDRTAISCWRRKHYRHRLNLCAIPLPPTATVPPLTVAWPRLSESPPQPSTHVALLSHRITQNHSPFETSCTAISCCRRENYRHRLHLCATPRHRRPPHFSELMTPLRGH